MINLKYIEIRNFMGIEKFRVDIEEVGRGSLVFILGHNGAGKSSVLEAILYALTSQVERLRGKAGILRQGADSGYVEVQFYGADGNLYQVRRSFSQGKSGLKTRSQIRVRGGKLWRRLENVPDKDTAVNEAIMKVLGIEGKITDILKSTFLIMQGQVEDMVVKKKPMEILGQSGVVPFKEDDMKEIIKAKLDHLKTREQALGDALVSDRNLIYEAYNKIAPFIEHYDSVLSARWEDVYEGGSDVMLLKLVGDTAHVSKGVADKIKRYMPSFDAGRELERLRQQIKETASDISRIKADIEKLEGDKAQIEAFVEKRKAYLADMGITPQSMEGLKYLSYLRSQGLKPEFIQVLADMSPVDVEEYRESYESLRKYAPVRSKKEKVLGTYRYLHEHYKDTSEEEIKRLKAQVDKKKILSSRKEALQMDISELKEKLLHLKKEVASYQAQVEECRQRKQKVEDRYRAIEPFIPYISLLQKLVHIEKEMHTTSEQIRGMVLPDIDALYKMREEYRKKYETITRIKAGLEVLPETTTHRTSEEIVEKWVVDYGRYMHARDGVCPVCGASHHIEPAVRPAVSDELIGALGGIQALEVEKKRRRLLDMLKKICPDSTSVDDALARIRRMWNDIQKQIDRAQTVIKKHETLRERLDRLGRERAEVIKNIDVPVPEHLTDAFVSDIIKTQRAYDEIVADLQTSMSLLNEKVRQYKDVKQQLRTKEKEMTEIINELEDIPDDVEQKLEEITVYVHLRGDEKILLGDVSQGGYYAGFEKDARAYVLYKRTSRQISDMLGRHLLKVVDKLPSPTDIEKFNEYIIGIKSRSASLVYHKHFADIYENIDKIVDMLTELEEKEKELQRVSSDISTAHGHLRELTRRMQEMKEQEDTLVALIQQVPDDITRAIEESGMSPEVVLDRLREAHIGMKTLRDNFEKHIVDMNRIQKQIELLKHIRRHVVPRFFKWYVDMIMSVFRNRLSDNLEMLSGRYRLESMQGDSGIEVYDKWNGAVRPATMLSGGEKTMLGLSFVFALADVVAGYGGHRVFFIDEGFSSLDSQRKQELKPVLENLVSSSGHTIFIITHDESILDSAPPESPVIRMEKGKMKDGISTVGAQLGTSYVGGEESDEDDIGVFLE